MGSWCESFPKQPEDLQSCSTDLRPWTSRLLDLYCNYLPFPISNNSYFAASTCVQVGFLNDLNCSPPLVISNVFPTLLCDLLSNVLVTIWVKKTIKLSWASRGHRTMGVWRSIGSVQGGFPNKCRDCSGRICDVNTNMGEGDIGQQVAPKISVFRVFFSGLLLTLSCFLVSNFFFLAPSLLILLLLLLCPWELGLLKCCTSISFHN